MTEERRHGMTLNPGRHEPSDQREYPPNARLSHCWGAVSTVYENSLQRTLLYSFKQKQPIRGHVLLNIRRGYADVMQDVIFNGF